MDSSEMGKYVFVESRTKLATVVAAVALCLTGCSNSETGPGVAGDPGTRNSTSAPGPHSPDPAPVDLTRAPTTYAEAVAHVDSALGTKGLDSFQSPSGNLHCRFERTDPYGVACELVDGRVEPAAGDECPSGVGVETIGRIEMMGASLRAVCNTDTIVDPNHEALGYGHAVSSGRFSCIIEMIGVTCVAVDSERGFFLARGSYRLFR